MLTNSLFVLAVGLVLPFVEASYGVYSSPESCTTGYGSKSIYSVPTTRKTSTLTETVTLTKKSTFTTTTTTRLAAKTTTKTDLTTTTVIEVGVVKTATLKLTLTESSITTLSDISTITEDLTEISTTVIPGTTLTIATVSGFVQINDTPGTPPSKKKRSEGHERRMSVDKLDMHKRDSKRYPTAVTCKKSIKVIKTATVTVRGATTTSTSTLPGSTKTSSVTSTITTVETVFLAPPTKTITIADTTTLVATTTLSSSTTITSTTTTAITISERPTATVYDACNSSNMKSSIRGNLINGSSSRGYVSVTFSIRSATDCCIQCQRTDNCAGYAALFFDAAIKQCVVYYAPGQCQGSLGYEAFAYSDQSPAPIDRRVVGNGNCGFGSPSQPLPTDV